MTIRCARGTRKCELRFNLVVASYFHNRRDNIIPFVKSLKAPRYFIVNMNSRHRFFLFFFFLFWWTKSLNSAPNDVCFSVMSWISKFSIPHHCVSRKIPIRPDTFWVLQTSDTEQRERQQSGMYPVPYWFDVRAWNFTIQCQYKIYQRYSKRSEIILTMSKSWRILHKNSEIVKYLNFRSARLSTLERDTYAVSPVAK